MTGSFRPIDDGEWSAQAYLGPIELLFAALGTGWLKVTQCGGRGRAQSIANE